MATQPFLDATKGAVYDTPAEWTAIADAWEAVAPALEVAEVESWIEAGVKIPIVRTVIMDRGLTAEDVGLIKQFITSEPLPALEISIASIAMLKAMIAAGFQPTDEARPAMLGTFFSELSSANVTVTLNDVP